MANVIVTYDPANDNISSLHGVKKVRVEFFTTRGRVYEAHFSVQCWKENGMTDFSFMTVEAIASAMAEGVKVVFSTARAKKVWAGIVFGRLVGKPVVLVAMTGDNWAEAVMEDGSAGWGFEPEPQRGYAGPIVRWDDAGDGIPASDEAFEVWI